jgi:hypothetical protein
MRRRSRCASRTDYEQLVDDQALLDHLLPAQELPDQARPGQDAEDQELLTQSPLGQARPVHHVEDEARPVHAPLHAAAGRIVMASFGHGYEDPTLSRRFGAEYEGYPRAVPAWWPRPHPWQPSGAAGQETS